MYWTEKLKRSLCTFTICSSYVSYSRRINFTKKMPLFILFKVIRCSPVVLEINFLVQKHIVSLCSAGAYIRQNDIFLEKQTN